MIRRLLVLLALALPATARADIPPDPDSPDAHCTTAEQCPTGETCPYAFNPGDRGGESEKVGADCRDQMSKKGLEKRCRNGGNYSGEHLFCPPGATGSWSPPGQPKPEPTPAPEPPPEPTPAPESKPEPATPAPAVPEATRPSKASMCSLTGGSPGLFALLILARRRRR